MGFEQGIQHLIEDAFRSKEKTGWPADRIAGQLVAGQGGPLPPGGNTGSGYTPSAHTHPLSDLEQSGAADGDMIYWSDSGDAWDLTPTAAAGRALLAVAPVSGGAMLYFDVLNNDWDLTGVTTAAGRTLLSLLPMSDGLTPVSVSGVFSLATFQPLDSDLTAIAALSTTSYGRSFLTLADATASRTYIDAQQADADLTAIAALSTTSFGRDFLTLADAAAARTYISAQPLDSDLTAIAALSTTSFGRDFLTLADAAASRTYIGALADSLTATRIPYGSAGGIFTSEADLAYIEADNELRAGRLRVAEQSTPSTPSSGFATLFASSVGVLSGIDDAGVVRQMVRYASTTFVPTLVGSGTAGTFTYDTNTTEATYWRVENEVKIVGRIRITAISVSPTGNLSIGNLPFTSANLTNRVVTGAGSITTNRGLSHGVGMTEFGLQVSNNVTTVDIIDNGSGVAPANVQGSALALISGSANLVFELTYQIV